MPTSTHISPPTISYAHIVRALSPNRLAAYSKTYDHDSVDAIARYLWNMALGAALTPVLHLVEVTFRNALYEAGRQTTAKATFRNGIVPCWLDAKPSLLLPAEERSVAEAITRLGRNPARHTSGHLIGQLGFGFWVRLCQRPYEHGNKSGPQLWPTAIHRFPHVPKKERSRPCIHDAFSELRDYRNNVAHHQPIWDRKPLEMHGRSVEVLGWMNQHLASLVRARSPFEAVFHAGHQAFRQEAEQALII
jgi:hypothetical protein